MTKDELIAAVEALPDHWPEGYEWEWGCQLPLHGEPCAPYMERNPEHEGDLISRERVLALLRGVQPDEVAPYIQPARVPTPPGS